MTMMKRMREEDREVEALAMANCLMLLSRVGATAGSTGGEGRVFTCKTCHREFSSFQALGGHRASHKKPRLIGGGDDLRVDSPAKPKSHECLICGAEFPIGQALGGHMRRHRLKNALSTHSSTDNSQNSGSTKSEAAVPVLKKSNSRSKRVSLCLDLDLDLNLTPHENHIKKINALSLTSWLIA